MRADVAREIAERRGELQARRPWFASDAADSRVYARSSLRPSESFALASSQKRLTIAGHPRQAFDMAVNLLLLRSGRPAPRRRPLASAPPWPASARPNRRDLTVVRLDPGAAVAGVFTSNRFCAAPGAAVPRAPRRGRRDPRACSSTPATPTPAPAPTGWRGRGSTCAALARTARLPAGAGAAVLHRRDHGDAAGRAHRGRPARRAWPTRARGRTGRMPPRRS